MREGGGVGSERGEEWAVREGEGWTVREGGGVGGEREGEGWVW